MSWYVASPFSHPDAAVRAERHRLAAGFCAWAAAVVRLPVYSPIVHWYEPARMFAMPTDAAFWGRFNNADLLRSDGVIVLAIPGWADSVGIAAELALAAKRTLSVRYARPKNARGWVWEWISAETAQQVAA